MTPEKQKAIELVDKYYKQPIQFLYTDSENDQCIGTGNMTYKSAIDCAIIEVNRIIEELKRNYEINYERIVFYKAVKQEIENLK